MIIVDAQDNPINDNNDNENNDDQAFPLEEELFPLIDDNNEDNDENEIETAPDNDTNNDVYVIDNEKEEK